MSKKQSKEKVTSEYVTVRISDKVYFQILAVCLRKRISLDQFASDAITSYLDKLNNHGLKCHRQIISKKGGIV